MDILYILVPIAILLAGIAIIAFILSVRSGQYDDLEGPGHRILMDDDDPMIPRYEPRKKALRK
ncbi:MAG TPA: cbb3-type cytochrome oxidase assembly protein CcoS [Gammaproteobacteria bacterium]|nr:cbb3-type cytochrome oxidase assembly protein CcoS [Gammaproteobacteria bacterium]